MGSLLSERAFSGLAGVAQAGRDEASSDASGSAVSVTEGRKMHFPGYQISSSTEHLFCLETMTVYRLAC